MRAEAIELYNHLTSEWNKKPQNLEKCLELLSKLKVKEFFLFYEDKNVF
jgi:hypothetical protein